MAACLLVALVLEETSKDDPRTKMYKNRHMRTEVTYKQFITAIRSKLEDDGTRIADAPWPSRETWWPKTTDFGQELLSDYGMSSSFPEIERAFNDEVGTIRDLIKEKWPEEPETASQRVLMGLEHHAAALRSWDEIAIPVRRRGDLVFRILSPRDAMGGPIIQTLHVDHYIRGVTIKTAENAYSDEKNR